MSRNLVPPSLPVPPAQYEQRYMAEITRALSQLVVQMQNPGELRATTITLTDLPTSAAGLETGALYNDGGTVKIVT